MPIYGNEFMNLWKVTNPAAGDFRIVKTPTEKWAATLARGLVMRSPVLLERHLATTTTRTVWTTPDARVGEVNDVSHVVAELDPGGPDPFADEPKWPAWKVTIAVVVFCAAFWTGIGYLAMRLMG